MGSRREGIEDSAIPALQKSVSLFLSPIDDLAARRQPPKQICDPALNIHVTSTILRVLCVLPAVGGSAFGGRG